MTINKNKLPVLTSEILEKFLKPLNPNISDTCLLNVLNSKLAQMITFKRVQFKELEFEKPKILNYYALNFISSGGGKDKIVNEIDDYLLSDFKIYFNSKNKDYFINQVKKLEIEATNLFTNDSKQKAYIETEKKKIRNLRFEMEQATSEGLFADYTALNQAGYGSIFVKMSELGLFLENPTQAQQLFLADLLKVYDGKASIKSTKGESQTLDVDGIPCNILAYSDINKLKKDKAGSYLNKMLDTGLVRRAFITYMADHPLKIELDYRQVMKVKNEAYKQAQSLKDEIIKRFMNIKQDSVFQLTEQAYEVFYSYKTENEQRYNERLNKSDDILLKEVRSRFWKCLKLAGLIACFEHPENTDIYPEDVKMAIYQTDLFAQDLERFFKAKPETDIEKLFKYFLENNSEWITKNDLRKQNFIHPSKFKRWFDDTIIDLAEFAEEKGYTLEQEKFKTNGIQYRLTKNNIGESITQNVVDITKIVNQNKQKPCEY